MEATHGSFVYRDTLFADVGQGKRVPRATLADLNALLLPKKNAVPVKDETANFYIAQLMHYGLPKTKDKNTAKVRLTSALSAGQLAVPTDIQKIEADLKKEYASLQRKSKSVVKKKQDGAQTEPAGQKRKAGAMEETKISITVGDMTIAIDRSSVPTAAKKQRNTAQKKEVTQTKATPKKATTESSTTTPVKPSPAKAKLKATAKPVSKSQTAKSKEHSSLSRPIQTARRSVPFPTVHSNEEEEDVPPPYSEYDDYDDDEDFDQRSNVIQISGAYEMDAVGHDVNATMNLRLSNPRDQLWGRFYLGDREGLIRMDHIGDIAQGTRKSFGWRSEDAETGTDLRFGKNCDGWMEFDGHGRVQGVFFGFKVRGRFEDVRFQGLITQDYACESDGERDDILGEVEREWHGFPERAYGKVF